MSAQAIIDGLEFARSGQRLHGEMEVAQLARLADSLFDAAGRLSYALSGSWDAKRRPRLDLIVEGEIGLRCQRCLERLAFPLAVKSSLLVLTGDSGGETAALDDLDGVVADPHTEVRALIEDEVLLAIPIAPRHPEGQCGALAKSARDDVPSPFAALARLKQN